MRIRDVGLKLEPDELAAMYMSFPIIGVSFRVDFR
jgi:hypothetical protein